MTFAQVKASMTHVILKRVLVLTELWQIGTSFSMTHQGSRREIPFGITVSKVILQSFRQLRLVPHVGFRAEPLLGRRRPNERHRRPVADQQLSIPPFRPPSPNAPHPLPPVLARP